MKAIYLNVLQGEYPKIVDIKDDLKTYYELLKCDTIDIVTRTIQGKNFSVVCNDEGLFVEKPIVSAIDKNKKCQFVGNLLFCGMPTDEGEMTSLTEDEIKTILSNLYIVFDSKTQKHFIIGNVEF